MLQKTGTEMEIVYEGRTLRFLNQRNKGWTYPYDYITSPNETLSSSGCGLFSLCHAVEWMHGIRLDPERLSDFARQKGGRGDDGTDRPEFLHALMIHGEAERMGFRYEEDGLRNDLDTLWEHISNKKGVSLCNLRVGHIVALVDSREVNGEKQLLAIDSYSESAAEKVRDHVRKIIPQSEVIADVLSKDGFITGQTIQYAMFWVTASLPKDFNLLHETLVQKQSEKSR